MHWILGVGLTALVFFGLKYWAGLNPEQKKTAGWKLGLGAAGVVLLLMVLTGRVHILVAAVAALVPLLRKLPALLRFAPLLGRVFQHRNEHAESREGGSAEGQGGSRSASGGMSVTEACNTLGVSQNCSREEIIAAHRRLIQKLHPDRGGNDYLAARVNEAKSVLLRSRG